MDLWVNQWCFLKKHIEKQDDPFNPGQDSCFAENSRTVETLGLSQSNFLKLSFWFCGPDEDSRNGMMECSLLPSPDVLTPLIRTSSARTKQEENTDCMGYLLRTMTKFLVRERQLYFRRAHQGMIVVQHMEEESSSCSSARQIPNKDPAARSAGVRFLSCSSSDIRAVLLCVGVNQSKD